MLVPYGVSYVVLFLAARLDDTTGALTMTVVIALALFGLLICNMADLMEVLGDGEGRDPGPGVRHSPGWNLEMNGSGLTAAAAQGGLLGSGDGEVWRRM